jgi:hypothetical protein
VTRATAFFAITALAALVAGATGQAHANSVYSVGGLGEPSLVEGARLRALGGAGVAEHGERTHSFVNPASIAEAEHLLIEGTILPSYRRLDSVNFGKETGHETAIPSLRALIRLPTDLVLAGSYLVGTNAHFDILREETAGTPSTLRIEGRGGLDLIRVSLARKATPGLRLGVDYEIIAGSFREEWSRDFADTALATARDTLETSYSRYGRWRIGAQYSRGRVSVGGVYETARRLPLTITQRTAGTVVQREGESLTIPSGFTLGFSTGLTERLRLVGQYGRANWDRASLASDLVDFRAEERYSFGVERQRSPEANAALLNRLPIRVGATLLRWPDLLPVSGATSIAGGTAEINEVAFSIGTGLQSRDKGGAIDLSLEAGSRGSKDDFGVSERFVRFAVSLQVSDDTWK